MDKGILMAIVAALAVVGLLFMVFQGDERDGGWITDTHRSNHLHGIGYDDATERLYLATHFGLFVHENGEVRQVSNRTDDFMGFSFHDAGLMYASGHPSGGGNMGVIRSTDGGVEWEQVFTGVAGEIVDFHAMAFSPADPDVLTGWFAGRLYVSGDGARTWRADATVPGGACWGAACLSLDAHGRLYAGTSEGLLVSDELGAQWDLVEPGSHAGVLMHQGVLYAHSGKGLRSSADGGATWEEHPFAGQAPVFAFAAGQDVLFAATTGSEVHRSTDGGASWHLYLP